MDISWSVVSQLQNTPVPESPAVVTWLHKQPPNLTRSLMGEVLSVPDLNPASLYKASLQFIHRAGTLMQPHQSRVIPDFHTQDLILTPPDSQSSVEPEGQNYLSSEASAVLKQEPLAAL